MFHPEWVGERIERLTGGLGRFRDNPGTLAACFVAAVFVQATMVVFYFAVAYALNLNVSLFDLGVIVPISFVVQMLPVSINGLGVREATFSFYFTRIGQPIEAAVLLSLVAQALIMLFSLSGAAIYVSRGSLGWISTISHNGSSRRRIGRKFPNSATRQDVVPILRAVAAVEAAAARGSVRILNASRLGNVARTMTF